MLGFRPRICHKGLILLAVPLAFEFVVAATLVYLQHYYGEAVKAEALRKQIIVHTNNVWYHNTWMICANVATAFLGHEPGFLGADKVSREYQRLKKLIADDSQQRVRLDSIMLCHERINKLVFQLKPMLSDSGGSLGQVLALKANLATSKRLVEEDIEAGALIRAFREYEIRQSQNAHQKVRLIGLWIQLVFAGAIIGSSVIAYLLFRYFMQGIHRGVQVLLLDIRRFKAREPLGPAIDGTDELALLDERFREMTDEVSSGQKMRRAFVTTVSREIQSPITSARGYLTQLSGGSLGVVPEESRLLAQKAEKTLDRLIGLMSDLLALEAAGKFRIPITPRQCSLAEIIQMSIDAVYGYADKHGIRLESQSTQAQAHADPDRIVQVLVNLLSNAVKFSPEGSAVLVSAVQIDGEVEVRVTDTGRGLPTHKHEAVFEQFEQVATTDANVKGGSGLGLPICKELIELHGGRIGVESEEGQGSTFWFRLPAVRVSEE